MERDSQLDLYRLVADRLKDAHTRVRALQVPEGVRMALTRKLLVITAAAKHDLSDAAKRLDRLMKDLDEGRFPEEPGSHGTR
jgi:cell division protein YceG involved in septum cleavage